MTTKSGIFVKALKTSWNNFYIRLLYLFVAISLLVTIVIVERQHNRPVKHPLLDVGDIDAIDVRWKGQSARVVRNAGIDRGSEEPQWTVRQIQGQDLINTRGNQGFITHFVDLLKNATAHQEDTLEMTSDDAAAYGLIEPALAVNLAWKVPSPGEEVVLFGNKDLTGKLVYVFFPRGPKLVKSAATVFKLLEGKTVEDFRDRHLVTFKTDDIEELRTEGKCGLRSLWRNGDHWEWRAGQELDDTDAWLDIVTEQNFSEETPGAAGSLWCTLVFDGRLGKKETLRIYEDPSRGLTAINSGLPGFYKIQPSFKNALAVSKSMVRRPRPISTPTPTPAASATPAVP